MRTVNCQPGPGAKRTRRESLSPSFAGSPAATELDLRKRLNRRLLPKARHAKDGNDRFENCWCEPPTQPSMGFSKAFSWAHDWFPG